MTLSKSSYFDTFFKEGAEISLADGTRGILTKGRPMTATLSIVGAKYRPPAEAILGVLAIGTPLTLRPEPTNPADSNAKAVWVRTSDISNEAFVALDDGRLKRFTMTIKDLALRDEWHLGYISKEVAAKFALHSEIQAEFVLSLNHGYPMIRFQL